MVGGKLGAGANAGGWGRRPEPASRLGGQGRRRALRQGWRGANGFARLNGLLDVGADPLCTHLPAAPGLNS